MFVKRLCIGVLLTTHLIFCAESFNFAEYHIVDTSRRELYPHDINHPYREFMIHVWSPKTQEQCPLILFSHGLGGTFNGLSYTALCEYCASHGYVVVSVSHMYASKLIQLPDGRSAGYLFPAQFHYQQKKDMYSTEIETWVADMMCTLDWCAEHDIDLSRVGVMGHSLGGSTAIQLCRSDSRIKAAVNFDGPLYGANKLSSVDQPVMFIVGSFVAPGLNPGLSVAARDALMWAQYFGKGSLPLINAFISVQQSDVYKITIEGIVHGTFSDQALMPDPTLLPWLIDGNQAHTIINSYVTAFFDCYLKHQYVPLLQEVISCWPNVTVEKNNYLGRR
jgi:dienelactone hydrolase